MQAQQRWAIIGGGFLGMTLALRLAQQGKACHSLRGCASWAAWPAHGNSEMSSGTGIITSRCRPMPICVLCCAELGLEDEMQWTTTRTGFYIDSELYSLSNTLEFLSFPL